ncbi:NAD(P)-dependent alcohol dehydrogenase [Halapricum hydrolyticum]|uniref:NAD(P)-dependent alcohol dehydrogenase n=1 Tax=Halapricum hydrolyticum TaxID=2979991 RepID=A0AAE3LJ27_9EURY|nr:NAD(P)-dependent alcohol dehydrogenase [Halapricum hydrolyticum]MCU4719266.1 NAD(P)-dependent alcohol dehydrogenase [Halapricum hydrolyticum]MCU4728549.1 NAD(P)-dependent alcohol dehydrogenase [Halapricum hydrolyticum]
MKAFVMKEIGETAVIEKERPEPGPMDAILKPTVGLICTSDTHTVHGAIGDREDLTLGHEIVGVVDEVGEEVEDFEPGDRVAVGAITPDWNSEAAQDGHPSQSNGALGGWKFANVKDGTFAEYAHINDADGNLAHIPDSVTDHEAAYTADMLSTGFAGAENADIPMGGTVAVFAQGPVGMMATKGAELQGAGRIIAVETVENRKELAREYGATDIVDFEDGDPVEQIMELTDGKGVDAAIEALGADQTLQDCIKVTKPGGTVSNVGYHGDGEFRRIPREEWGVGMAEIDIVTDLCPGGRLRIRRLLRLLEQGKVDPTKMTTHEFDFEDIKEAFEMMEAKDDDIIKPLIRFD